MEYLLILIPIIFFIVGMLYLKYKKYSLNFPVLLYTTIAPIFAILVSILSVKTCSTDDVEYLNYYYTKVRHTDRWNEYIHRTCTKKFAIGKNSDGSTKYITKEYDCSYVDNHPERWIAYDNNGNEIYLSEEEFNRIIKRWKCYNYTFVDMHRHYHTIDGDAQDYFWDRNKSTIVMFTKEHRYENRIIHSQSAFKLRDISDEEANELGLYDYPKIINGRQNPFIGYTKFISNKSINDLQYINAIYGRNKQINNYVLIFKNQPISIADDQRCYWQNGNKNEFVTCVGIDSNTNELEWVYCFSWLDDATMELQCRDYLMRDSVFNADKYNIWLENNLNLWKRKEFADFKYINVYLTNGQIQTLFWISLIISVISLIICIIMHKNDNY